MSLAIALPSVVHGIIPLQTRESALKFLAEDERSRPGFARSYARASFLVDVFAAVLTVVIVSAAAPLARRSPAWASVEPWLFIVVSLGVGLGGLARTAGPIHLVLGEYRPMAKMQAAGNVAGTAVVLTLAGLGLGIDIVIAGVALKLALPGLLLTANSVLLIRQRWAACRGGSAAVHDRRREILRHLGFTGGSSIVGALSKRLDVVLAGALAGPTGAGHFNLAKSAVDLISTVIGPVQSALYPRLATAWGARDIPSLRRHVRGTGVPLGLAVGALVLAAIWFVRPVVTAVFGEDYLPAVPLVQILLPAAAVWSGFLWLRPLVVVSGHVRFWLAMDLLGSVILFCGYVILWPLLGLAGLAWPRTASIVVTHSLAAYYVFSRGWWREASQP